MINIDLENRTYVCPFCGHTQAVHSFYRDNNGPYRNISPIAEQYWESSFTFYTLECSNSACSRVALLGINRSTKEQIDLVPKVTMKHYPDYIPEQIRRDYEEANQILEASPKSAATLLRRCLQGMIHDFWNIHEKNLNAEITQLKERIPAAQWKAIDALRTVGNIGAHMEHDVNLIIDIDPDEARKLLMLIELLMDKWYIARYDEEQLLADIAGIAEAKSEQRKK